VVGDSFKKEMTWSPELYIRETEAEIDAAGSLAVWGNRTPVE